MDELLQHVLSTLRGLAPALDRIGGGMDRRHRGGDLGDADPRPLRGQCARVRRHSTLLRPLMEGLSIQPDLERQGWTAEPD
jgi:hypothetical protein